MRYAIVRNARDVKHVAAYLPANYDVVANRGWRGEFEALVGGEDVAGWTLDDYVIPRLASGLLWATELTESEALAAFAVKADG